MKKNTNTALLYLDFSDKSIHAAKFAISHFALETRFILFHNISNDPNCSNDPVKTIDQRISLARIQLNQIREMLLSNEPKIQQMDLKVSVGSAGKNTLQLLSNEYSTMIVMGVDKEDIRAISAGRHIGAILQDQKVAVLLVPESLDLNSIQKGTLIGNERNEVNTIRMIGAKKSRNFRKFRLNFFLSDEVIAHFEVKTINDTSTEIPEDTDVLLVPFKRLPKQNNILSLTKKLLDSFPYPSAILLYPII